MKTLFQLFVDEGHRLYREGELLLAIRSLKNAYSCREILFSHRMELSHIIHGISNELRFGKRKV